jgi:hypothetical protein
MSVRSVKSGFPALVSSIHLEESILEGAFDPYWQKFRYKAILFLTSPNYQDKMFRASYRGVQ